MSFQDRRDPFGNVADQVAQALGHHIEVRSQMLLRVGQLGSQTLLGSLQIPLWPRESAGSLQSDRLDPRPPTLLEILQLLCRHREPPALLDVAAGRRASSRGSRSSRHYGCAPEHMGLWQRTRIPGRTPPPSVRRIEYSRQRERRGLRHLEGQAVAGADAEQVSVSAVTPKPARSSIFCSERPWSLRRCPSPARTASRAARKSTSAPNTSSMAGHVRGEPVRGHLHPVHQPLGEIHHQPVSRAEIPRPDGPRDHQLVVGVHREPRPRVAGLRRTTTTTTTIFARGTT